MYDQRAQPYSVGSHAEANVTIPTTTESQWKEWAECRATIGRFDTLLVDFRKVGFSLVTGLLTASAFLGLTKAPTPTIGSLVAAIVSIMVLIAVLSAVDTYYEVLLSGAVERALDIEMRTEPHVRITRYISTNSRRTKAVLLIWALYIVLLVTTCGLGVLSGIVAGSSFAVTWVSIIGGLLLVLMLANWIHASVQTHVHRGKTRTWPEDPQ